MGTILLILVVGAALWAVSAYNRLIALGNDTTNAWKQIDVQLKRRHDLIPNLVSTVKGMMTFERSTLEAVVEARSKAMGARGVKATAEAEAGLTQALGRFFAVAESYPELKASQNVLQLQQELAATENRVTAAREAYNDVATRFNTAQAQFPTRLVAGMARAVPAELWEIVDEAEREVPKVDLQP